MRATTKYKNLKSSISFAILLFGVSLKMMKQYPSFWGGLGRGVIY